MQLKKLTAFLTAAVIMCSMLPIGVTAAGVDHKADFFLYLTATDDGVKYNITQNTLSVDFAVKTANGQKVHQTQAILFAYDNEIFELVTYAGDKSAYHEDILGVVTPGNGLGSLASLEVLQSGYTGWSDAGSHTIKADAKVAYVAMQPSRSAGSPQEIADQRTIQKVRLAFRPGKSEADMNAGSIRIINTIEERDLNQDSIASVHDGMTQWKFGTRAGDVATPEEDNINAPVFTFPNSDVKIPVLPDAIQPNPIAPPTGDTGGDGTTEETAYSYIYTGVAQEFTGDVAFTDYTGETDKFYYEKISETEYDTTPLGAAPKDVGTYKYVVSISATDPTYSGSVEYFFNITPAPLTYKANALTFAARSYDGTNEVHPATALVGSNFDGWVDTATTEVVATYTVADKNVGDNKPVTANVTVPSNYSLAGAEALNVGTIKINAVEIPTQELALTGASGKPLSTVKVPTQLDGVKDEKITGTFVITNDEAKIKTGANPIDYTFTHTDTNYISPFEGTTNVVGKDKTPVVFSKIEVPEISVYSKTPVTVSGTPEATAGYKGTPEVGYYTAEGVKLDSAPKDVGNYKYVVKVPDTDETFTGETAFPFEITPKPLTVTAENKSKVYDNAVFTGFTSVISGNIAGDAVPTNTATAITYTGAATTAITVGTHTISVNVDGANSSDANYTFNGATKVDGTLTINKAGAPTIAVTNLPTVYTGAAQAPVVTIDRAGPEVVTYKKDNAAGELVQPADIKNAGTYYYSVEQTDKANYETVAPVTGTFTIAQAEITIENLDVTPEATRAYNGTNVAVLRGVTGTLTGNLDGANLTLKASATGTFADANVGTAKDITVVTSGIELDGSAKGNYVIKSMNTVTDKTANITPAPLNLTFAGEKAYNTVYDDKLITGLSIPDEEKENFFEESLADILPGTATVIESDGCPADANVIAGGYDVKAKIGGGQASNYAITITGKLVVNPIALPIDAIGASPLTKVYDGNTSTPTDFALSIISGLFNNDVVTATFTNAGYTKPGVADTDNKIAVNGIALGGADAANYTLSNTKKDFVATITPKQNPTPEIPEDSEGLIKPDDIEKDDTLVIGDIMIDEIKTDSITVRPVVVTGSQIEYGYKVQDTEDEVKWQDSNVITALTMNTKYEISVRIKAPDGNTLPSEAKTKDVTTTNGFEVKGKVKAYNPNNETVITLTGTGASVGTNYETKIVATTGAGQVEQEFSFAAVAPGTYTMVVTKAAHASITITNIVVSTSAIDLSKNTESKIAVITLLCGDINGSGSINVDDLGVLKSSANYDKGTTENGVNALADLNGSGSVNVDDLGILKSSANYDKGSSIIEMNNN